MLNFSIVSIHSASFVWNVNDDDDGGRHRKLNKISRYLIISKVSIYQRKKNREDSTRETIHSNLLSVTCLNSYYFCINSEKQREKIPIELLTSRLINVATHQYCIFFCFCFISIRIFNLILISVQNEQKNRNISSASHSTSKFNVVARNNRNKTENKIICHN